MNVCPKCGTEISSWFHQCPQNNGATVEAVQMVEYDKVVMDTNEELNRLENEVSILCDEITTLKKEHSQRIKILRGNMLRTLRELRNYKNWCENVPNFSVKGILK